MSELITCISLGSTDCCMSCHDDKDELGYPMCEIEDDAGHFRGEVCCRVLDAFAAEIEELIRP